MSKSVALHSAGFSSLTNMSDTCKLSWDFSPEIQEKIREFISEMKDNDSNSNSLWKNLRNIDFTSSANDVSVSENEDDLCVEELRQLTLDYLESGLDLDESKFVNVSKKVLSNLFCEIQSLLSDTGFSNLCKNLSEWKDSKLLNAGFDIVVHNKLCERDEAPLQIIHSISELAVNKPEHLTRCIIKLVESESHSFTDEELLGAVFAVLPAFEKQEIIKALTEIENMKDSNLCLLLVLLPQATQSSINLVIDFMSRNCLRFSSSQPFARLLVQICKNFQSKDNVDVLFNIIDKNKTLLKKQALKYLSGDQSMH